MLVQFFYNLREARIPVTIREYLTFLEALDKGVAEANIDEFYYLSRASLVKDERFFDTFDLPDQNQTAAARNVSTVPTQALTLMNNEFVLNQASLFADRVRQEAPGDLDRQIALAYRIALTRSPTGDEAVVAKALVTEQSLVDLTHVMLNLNEFLYLR